MFEDELDRILDKYAEPQITPGDEDVLTEIVTSDGPILRIYTCQQDGYDVYYAPSLSEATYRFQDGTQLDVKHLTRMQVIYYLKTGYWQEC